MKIKQEEAALLLWSSPAFAVTIALLCYIGVSAAGGVFDTLIFVETLESVLPPNPVIFFVLYFVMGISTAIMQVSKQTAREFVYFFVVILVVGFYIGMFTGIRRLVQMTTIVSLVFLSLFCVSCLLSVFLTRHLLEIEKI